MSETLPEDTPEPQSESEQLPDLSDLVGEVDWDAIVDMYPPPMPEIFNFEE